MESRRLFRLLSAIRHHDAAEVRQLLDEGLDPDTKLYLSGRLKPALNLAVEERASEIVKILLEAGCSLSSTEANEDPLLTSCRNGDLEIVEALLRHNASVRSKDLNGKTALHLASGGLKPSQVEIIGRLVSHDAEIDAKDFDARTPLMYASLSVTCDVIGALLHHGADVTLADRHGMTSLHFVAISTPQNSASKYDAFTQIVEAVKFNVKSYVNKREFISGNTVLHCVIQSGKKVSADNIAANIVRKLIHLGADINAQNAEGRTPLHIACNAKQFECAKILITSGCKITTFDLLGRLPLIEAARDQDYKTLFGHS